MRRIGYKVVVNAGRMTIQKGIMQLLEAARLVVDKRPKTLFCWLAAASKSQNSK